jgi:hypothetical protein
MVGTLIDAATTRLQASKKINTEALCEELLLPRWGDASWGVTLDKWCGKGPTAERNRTIATGLDGPPLEHELAATWLVYHDDRKMARKCAKRYVPASCGPHYDDRHVSQLLEATYDMGERKDEDGGEAVRMMAKHLGFKSDAHASMVSDLAERIDAPIDPVIGGVALQVLVSAARNEKHEREGKAEVKRAPKRGQNKLDAREERHLLERDRAENPLRPSMVSCLLWCCWNPDKMNHESALAMLCLYRLKHGFTDYQEFKDAINHVAPLSEQREARKCISDALKAAHVRWEANGCTPDATCYEQVQRVLLAEPTGKRKKAGADANDSD